MTIPRKPERAIKYRRKRKQEVRQARAERYFSEFKGGKRSYRSIAALTRNGSRLDRWPDWVEDDEGVAICQSALLWLRRAVYAYFEHKPEPDEPCGLTDALESTGQISREEADRRREVTRHRHEDTNYDSLLQRGFSRDEARDICV